MNSQQEKIIETIKNNSSSIYVDAVAGSGKTTTILALARSMPDKKILQITYNKDLKFEVRQKVIEGNITNLEVHSYNSLAVKYFDDQCYNTITNKALLDKPKREIYADILVIDECQDMTDKFYYFISNVCKHLKNSNSKLKLLLMGDHKQAVYKNKDADPRYLTLAGKIWSKYDQLKCLPLATSYRLTNQMSNFINRVVLNCERIRAVKKGPPVKLIKADFYKAHNSLINYVTSEIKLFKKNGGRDDQIFILAPTLKKVFAKRLLKPLERELVNLGIKVFYNTDDDHQLTSSEITNKLVFSTFHSSKGRERPLVFVYGFDQSYLKYYSGYPEDTDICPEPLYVALTRASNQLQVIQSGQPLNFITNETNINNYAKIIDLNSTLNSNSTSNSNSTMINPNVTRSVSELVRYIKEVQLVKLNDLLDELFTQYSPASEEINIPNYLKHSKSNTCELIADVNGISILAYWLNKKLKNSDVLRICKFLYQKQKNKSNILIDFYDKTMKSMEKMESTQTTESNIEYYTRLAILYWTLIEGLNHKVAQLDHYNWLSSENVSQCCAVLERMFAHSDNLNLEKELDTNYHSNGKNVFINGRIDVIDDDDNFWELKCVDCLKIEHKLQLIIYIFINNLNNLKGDISRAMPIKNAFLANYRTGEILQLDTNNTDCINAVVDILLDNNLAEPPELTDDEFIDKIMSSENLNKLLSSKSKSTVKKMQQLIF